MTEVCSKHRAELEGSGLSTETVTAAGLYCANADEVRGVLGFDAGPGLVFPFASMNGHPPFSRVKPDEPFLGRDSKPAKYLSPKGAGNRLYIPPMIPRENLASKRIPLVITEGEKKALRAAQERIVCVGLTGVTAWKDKAGVIQDFNYIWLKGRKVFIVFDSDGAVNVNVKAAEIALAKELRRRGATVEAIRIPPGPAGRKEGLDDYLLTHSPETFWELPTDALSETDERKILSLGEFMAKPFPPVNSLWGDGILTAGSLGTVIGRAKLGKTWFTVHLALCLAGLARFFLVEDLLIHRAGRVLYLNAEVSEAIFQKRLGLVLSESKERGLDTDAVLKNFFPVTVRGSLQIDRKPGQQELVKMIERVRPNVVIVDPIGPLHNSKENEQSDMGRLLNYLLSIVNYYDAAMIVVHHMGKSTENREEIHFGRGSSVWGDRVDTNLNLMPYGEQGKAIRLKLSFTLRNGPPLDPLIVTRGEGEFLFHAVGQTNDTAEWLEGLLKQEGRIEREAAWERYKASGKTGEWAFRKALEVLEAQWKMKREFEGFPRRTILVSTVARVLEGGLPTV